MYQGQCKSNLSSVHKVLGRIITSKSNTLYKLTLEKRGIMLRCYMLLKWAAHEQKKFAKPVALPRKTVVMCKYFTIFTPMLIDKFSQLNADEKRKTT